jgi:polysaccharide export outer membrane protein
MGLRLHVQPLPHVYSDRDGWGFVQTVESQRGGSRMNRMGVFLVSLVVTSEITLAQTRKPASNDKVSSAIAAVQTGQAHQGTANADFVIGREDVLSISVWGEPEISSPKVVVRPDGKISVPLVNEIEATGLTTKQLQERIREGLKEYLDAPLVNVAVTEIHSQTVYILGEVDKPGAYPLGSPTTVLELIAKAGSFTEMARTKKIVITRNDGTRQVQLYFNYKDFLEGKNLTQNIRLKNGDIVIVP